MLVNTPFTLIFALLSDTDTLLANAYENEKSFDKAGREYMSAAELKAKVEGSRFEAVSSYASAAKAFRIIDPKLAIAPLEAAIEMCRADRKRDRIPKFGKQLAQLYEELGDLKNAVYWYKECAEMLQIDNMTSGARGDLASAAQLEGKMGLYREAADDFLACAKLAVSGRSGPSMKPMAKKDVFNAGSTYSPPDLWYRGNHADVAQFRY